MARKAKRDFNKGVYRMIYGYDDLTKFDLVYTYALDRDPKGKGLNCDLVLAKRIVWNDLKSQIKKHKITRAIWYGNGEDHYVIPKEVLNGTCVGVVVVNDVW